MGNANEKNRTLQILKQNSALQTNVQNPARAYQRSQIADSKIIQATFRSIVAKLSEEYCDLFAAEGVMSTSLPNGSERELIEHYFHKGFR